MTNLVEVVTPDFSAVLPSFITLPVRKVSAVMEAQDYEQFMLVVELIRSYLSPEKVDEFDELNASQVVKFMSGWIALSGGFE